MSNTSTVTPYEETNTQENATALAATCIASAVSGAITLAKWLSEETPEDKLAREQYKKARQKELISASNLEALTETAPQITSVNLHLQKADTLVQAAESLGYKIESLSNSPIELTDQTAILMRRMSGERLAIERTSKGKIVIHTIGGRQRVQELVRKHTMDRAITHLSKNGTVKTATLPSGEVQIFTEEKVEGLRGGKAEIKAQVNVDGTIWVDIDNLKGSRCTEVVSEIAESVGGEVSCMWKKDSFYQLPGEPTKTNVKI